MFIAKENEIIDASYKPDSTQSQFQSKGRPQHSEALNAHKLYQELFITDMKGEVQVVNSELDFLRQELALKDHQLEQMKEQSEEYRGKLNVYRNIIAEKKFADQMKAEEVKLRSKPLQTNYQAATVNEKKPSLVTKVAQIE